MPKWLIFDAYTLLICEKNVANYALLWCKTFSLKIWLCKILDKYHVWRQEVKRKPGCSKVNYQQHKDSNKGIWKRSSFLNEVKSEYCNLWKGEDITPMSAWYPPFTSFLIGQGEDFKSFLLFLIGLQTKKIRP